MKQRIVLLGPPASGKGTQADLMHARYQFPTASPGAILRDEALRRTSLGVEAERHTSEGRLAPAHLVNAVIEGWLERYPEQFVFDGYPRSVEQAEALEEMLSRRRRTLDVVLALEVDIAVIQGRVANRMVCNRCNRCFAVGLHIQLHSAPCPECRGLLTRRQDDSPHTLSSRMLEYAEKTQPLQDFYRKRDLLRKIDGAPSPQQVFQAIAGIIEAS